MQYVRVGHVEFIIKTNGGGGCILRVLLLTAANYSCFQMVSSVSRALGDPLEAPG